MSLVSMGMLTAIVVVLQTFAAGINIGGMFNITLTLFPIIIGAALFGWKAGAWLGCVFGAVVLFTGQAASVMTLNPAGTIITVMLKGTLAGLAAGLVYTLISKKNKNVADYTAVLISGIVAPVVNTGIYLLGVFVFFGDVIYSGAAAAGKSAWYYIIFFMVGGNFLVELAINLVLASAIVYLIRIITTIIKRTK